jgi:hypothetical protein
LESLFANFREEKLKLMSEIEYLKLRVQQVELDLAMVKEKSNRLEMKFNFLNRERDSDVGGCECGGSIRSYDEK